MAKQKHTSDEILTMLETAFQLGREDVQEQCAKVADEIALTMADRMEGCDAEELLKLEAMELVAQRVAVGIRELTLK